MASVWQWAVCYFELMLKDTGGGGEGVKDIHQSCSYGAHYLEAAAAAQSGFFWCVFQACSENLMNLQKSE